jgi:undecaprenyl-diphosphatase
MNALQSIILGIVQGLTEFLPVSSSAHLVIVPNLFGWQIQQSQLFPFDVLVQVASLFALLIYFRHDLLVLASAFIRGLGKKDSFQNPDSKLVWYLIIATIPAGIFGLIFKPVIEEAFSAPKLVGLFLIGTALILVIAERIGKRNRNLSKMTWKDALWVGCFQVLALFPGISRSGATLTGGMTRDLNRPDAARFAFLISIPIMFSAGIMASLDLIQISEWRQFIPVYLPGLLASMLVSYLAIYWFLGYLKNHRLYIFAFYCLIIGLLTFFHNL